MNLDRRGLAEHRVWDGVHTEIQLELAGALTTHLFRRHCTRSGEQRSQRTGRCGQRHPLAGMLRHTLGLHYAV